MMRVAPTPDFAAKFALQQKNAEFDRLLNVAKDCRAILEIGSCFGGSLAGLAFAMPKGSRIVSVDICLLTKFPHIDVEKVLRKKVAEIREGGYDAHLVVGNSRDADVISAARVLGPFDMVFIDGDHSYEGVRADWLNYGPMGRIIAFHDIRGTPGVHKLWEEIRPHHRTAEFVAGIGMGIGVLKRYGE